MSDYQQYTNPWFEDGKGSGPATYSRAGCSVSESKCGRGAIVTAFRESYDYLVNGRVVSQRAGKNMGLLDSLIACIHGEKQPETWDEERALETYNKQEAA